MTDGAWLPLVDVLSELGVDAGSDDAESVDRARLAAVEQVEELRPDLLDAGGVYRATPKVVEAAMLLVARLYARKGSPTGLASYGEFGPAPVARFDPDVERLLGVGRYAKPAVG